MSCRRQNGKLLRNWICGQGNWHTSVVTYDVVWYDSHCAGFLCPYLQFLEAEHCLYFLIISAACTQPKLLNTVYRETCPCSNHACINPESKITYEDILMFLHALMLIMKAYIAEHLFIIMFSLSLLGDEEYRRTCNIAKQLINKIEPASY